MSTDYPHKLKIKGPDDHTEVFNIIASSMHAVRREARHLIKEFRNSHGHGKVDYTFERDFDGPTYDGLEATT